MVSSQASIAAACYAVVILVSMVSVKQTLGQKVMGAGAAAIAAFISVCVINCYVTGGCGLLAWVFAGILVLALAGAIMMAVDGKTETLIYRDGDGTHNVAFKETPP